jgi:hypothetical protein
VTATTSTWTALGVLYLAFFSWYTSCEGPLTRDEIDHYLGLLAQNDPDASPEFVESLRDFLESDTGDDFVMWNNLDLHETPLPVEGVEPGETSRQVLGRYMEYMTPALFARACHPVILGSAAAPAPEMFGIEGVRDWTVGAGMRYRSRRDMLEIASNPAFQGAHRFKVAAIHKTFAFPIDPWFHLGDPRLLLALVCLVTGLSVGWLSARRAASLGGQEADPILLSADDAEGRAERDSS